MFGGGWHDVRGRGLDLAALLTAMVLVMNLGLRPLVNWLDRRIYAGLQRRRQAYRLDLPV